MRFFLALLLVLITGISLQNIATADNNIITALQAIGMTCYPKDLTAGGQEIVIKPDQNVMWQLSPVQIGNSSNVVLSGTVSGFWQPWGGNASSMKLCSLKSCQANGWLSGQCIDNADIPCALDKGVGLYGLIALKPEDGSFYLDPNLNDVTQKKYFRTFHIGDLTNQGASFALSTTSWCDFITGACEFDQNVMPGKLYFGFYNGDQVASKGEYRVSLQIKNQNATNQVQVGVVQASVEDLTQFVNDIAIKLQKGLFEGSKFRAAVKSLIAAFIILTTIQFALGVIKISQGDFMIMIFKLCVVSALASDISFHFFNTYLFNLIKTGAGSLSGYIVSLIVRSSSLAVPNNANVLSIYDSLFNLVTSEALNYKILAMTFYKAKIFAMIVVYLCVATVSYSISKAMMIYTLSIIQVAILLFVGPIFIAMLLFTVTKDLFENWMKALITNALLMIILAAVLVLMTELVKSALNKLLNYAICWMQVYELKIDVFSLVDWTLLTIDFWYPINNLDADAALTGGNVLALCLYTIMFILVLDKVPDLAKALSGNAQFAADSDHLGEPPARLKEFFYEANYRFNPVRLAGRLMSKSPPKK